MGDQFVHFGIKVTRDVHCVGRVSKINVQQDIKIKTKYSNNE